MGDAEILLLENVHSAADAVFAAAGVTVRRQEGALTGGPLRDAIGAATLLGIRSKSQINADAVAGAKNLLAVGCFCIGTNQVELAALGRQGVVVFNAPFSNTRSVAEMTLAEIIALQRRLFEKSSLMHSGRWDKSAATAHEVRGRTLGIVGYGHIGSQLSVLAEALGLRVIYHDIAQKLPLGNAQPRPSLRDVLREADVVTVHVPATDATANMFGAGEFAAMQPGAIFLNNARGSVVDTEALAAALRSGHLAGAAVDVHPREPSASSEPYASDLAGLSNVILTPHIGGNTAEAQQNIAQEVAEKLSRYLHHGTTTTAVNVPEVDLPQRRHDQHRILHIHHNVPGVLRTLHGILADDNININAEYLQSNAEVSYVILDVDAHHGPSVTERLRAVPETIRLRTLW